MGGATVGRVSSIAGRSEELGLLRAVIGAAAKGRPCAVFVHGEAGVGKTRLVTEVCREAAAKSSAILWGSCVRFGAVDAPYVALVGAFEGWVESANPAELSEVLAAVPGAGDLVSSSGRRLTSSAVRLLSTLDGLVHAIAERRPVVLVVDDVQWADPATRDAIAYLVAGFRSQRLAILVTYRDEELAAGHPLHGWLADLTRMVSVSSLRLARLSADETEEQLSSLLGGWPQPRLVAEVVRRSDGNPYLSELLVQGVSLTDDDLPADLPAELTGALLGAWHRLSAPAREVTRSLAVGGRPAAVDDLTAVAAAGGIGAGAVTAALIEATDAGICAAPGPELCWFRHPLLTEVLCSTFVPGEAVRIHAAWAKALESRSASGIDEMRRQGDLALHYERAHDLGASLEASLRAADLAHELKALREAAVHLGHAARLWPVVRRGTAQNVDQEVCLLERVAHAHLLAGDDESIYDAWSRAQELVDEETDPLRASRILRERAFSALRTGRATGEPIPEVERAIELIRRFPDSEEYAEALADLSESHTWNNAPDSARRYAEEAVQAAHRSGSNRALSHAYRARATAYLREERADRDSLESLQFARLASDQPRLAGARLIRVNYLVQRGRVAESTAILADGFREALDAGALRVATGTLCSAMAQDLLTLGQLEAGARVIRQGLALGSWSASAARTRLVAALLATRQGELDVARLHVRRAKELVPGLEESPELMAPPILAEYLLAEGEPEQALELLSRTMTVQSVDPRIADEMLMWSARSAAELAEKAHDRRDGEGVSRARRLLEDIENQRRRLRPEPFDVITPADRVQPAVQAVFAAESTRCMSLSVTSSQWKEAAVRCAAASMRWEETVALKRCAHALLDERANRADVAVPLRSAYACAVEMAAQPLRRQLESLAALAKIPLDEPASTPIDPLPEAFRSLTKREQQVLDYLVAGRTYPEIADALFISQKTVSTHVSNLLRKTGTSSRQEVSALAVRLTRP
ncbi:AAA family ATPase [Kribbella qitaiheensis]|uniref:helix-turn-helix transcriptional regulator n=1 Tax=Kribbella qitaiheensis TaxID=1544730 RepID=UPI00361017D3